MFPAVVRDLQSDASSLWHTGLSSAASEHEVAVEPLLSPLARLALGDAQCVGHASNNIAETDTVLHSRDWNAKRGSALRGTVSWIVFVCHFNSPFGIAKRCRC
jgi:hypothetical protein